MYAGGRAVTNPYEYSCKGLVDQMIQGVDLTFTASEMSQLLILINYCNIAEARSALRRPSPEPRLQPGSQQMK
jgi:hypothetical protein